MKKRCKKGDAPCMILVCIDDEVKAGKGRVLRRVRVIQSVVMVN